MRRLTDARDRLLHDDLDPASRSSSQAPVVTSGLEEVAYVDLYPENDNASFESGTWSNYPYLRQKGVVAVSSIDRGLFILQPRVGRAGG